MKKFIAITTAIFLSIVSANAQYTMKVIQDDGNVSEFPVSKIKEVIWEDLDGPIDDIDANGYEYVDLGLPSGTLWATCNLGATKPEEFGDYFAWGETEGFNSGKTKFSWATYKWCYGSKDKLNKYCYNKKFGLVDNLMELELEDDAAHVYMGGDWRMPTYEQVAEILTDDNCMKSRITQNGVKGILLTSRYNHKSIFIPQAGAYYDDRIRPFAEGALFCWTRSLYVVAPEEPGTLDCTCDALVLDQYSTLRGEFYDHRPRYEGLTIRPVITPREQ